MEVGTMTKIQFPEVQTKNYGLSKGSPLIEEKRKLPSSTARTKRDLFIQYLPWFPFWVTPAVLCGYEMLRLASRGELYLLSRLISCS
jgi:hypothetical protein